LTAALQAQGYRVSAAALDGRTAESCERLASAFGGRPPEILLADLTGARDCLPVQHARRALRCVWGEDLPLPLTVGLFQPAHLELPDWQAYVDDFILPPHAPKELAARISLLLFRRRHVEPENTVSLPGITIYLDAGRVQNTAGECVPVTPREFDLLRFLASHRGRLFSRGRLVDLVWGVDFEGGERTVDIHIRRLRAKLPLETAALLQTRRSVGYGFGAD
jgi:two-component system, OmpR family, alkaline phosphatase synthesis response regulator PhoP